MGRSFILISILIGITPFRATAAPEDLPGKLTPPQSITNPANDDEALFNFRLKHFAPDTEPFIKETFGNEVLPEHNEGYKEYPSYTSRVVSFSTNLPTFSIIKYGETQNYRQTTQQSDSCYYRHMHYIQKLRPNTSSHYRIKVQEHDGNLITSADHTFTTKALTSEIIRIPEDLPGQSPPNTLTTHNAKYILPQNLTIPTVAININALTTGTDPQNEIAFNPIRRFRHQDIMGSRYKHHHEAYSDNFDSNSFPIATGRDRRIEHNKMFAQGYNPVGTNKDSHTIISHNSIYIHSTAPNMRSTNTRDSPASPEHATHSPSPQKHSGKKPKPKSG
jgi:hypothetical protein